MDILSLPDNEPFIAGTDESIDICTLKLRKECNLLEMSVG